MLILLLLLISSELFYNLDYDKFWDQSQNQGKFRSEEGNIILYLAREHNSTTLKILLYLHHYIKSLQKRTQSYDWTRPKIVYIIM